MKNDCIGNALFSVASWTVVVLAYSPRKFRQLPRIAKVAFQENSTCDWSPGRSTTLLDRQILKAATIKRRRFLGSGRRYREYSYHFFNGVVRNPDDVGAGGLGDALKDFPPQK
jgi:hypothetical protein